MIFAKGLLLGETGGVAGVTKEVIEAFALILEASDTMEAVVVLIPPSETISIETKKEPLVGAPGVMGVEVEKTSTHSGFENYNIWANNKTYALGFE